MFKVPKLATLTKWVYENNPINEVAQITLENRFLDGRKINLKGQTALHFGNVSYLGLDTDLRLKKAAAEAIYNYGVQFSSSRAYLQLPLFEELEDLLAQIYDSRPTLVTPSTTLAHLAAMPLFFYEKDAVLIDYQAHASLQLCLETVRGKGLHIEVLAHGNMDLLEERLEALSQKFEKVWYIADGVYSMFGDICDVARLQYFYNRFENLYFYIDDAHGMSWTGKNGRGFAAENLGLKERMLLVTSLNKAFAAGGGAIVCPDEDTKLWLKRCGSSYVFSGPMQPSAVAAAIESAKIHLSPEINLRQQKLLENIRYFREQAELNHIRLIDLSESPIFFVVVGRVDTCARLCWHLREAGFFTNAGIFPAVPLNQSGLRISINYHHSKTDIRNLCRVLGELLPLELSRDNFSKEKKAHTLFQEELLDV